MGQAAIEVPVETRPTQRLPGKVEGYLWKFFRNYAHVVIYSLPEVGIQRVTWLGFRYRQGALRTLIFQFLSCQESPPQLLILVIGIKTAITELIYSEESDSVLREFLPVSDVQGLFCTHYTEKLEGGPGRRDFQVRFGRR